MAADDKINKLKVRNAVLNNLNIKNATVSAQIIDSSRTHNMKCTTNTLDKQHISLGLN